ncbi:MAG: DUF928 domain-containing protein [Phormidium sp.]
MNNSELKYLKISCIFSFVIFNLIALKSQVLADNLTKLNQPFLSLSLRQKGSGFEDDGRSGDRDGGGSRGNCPAIKPSLTALIPISNFGTTLAERPTFWFYVPYSNQQVTSGEFVLQNRERNDIIRIPFKLPNQPGYVSFTIPPTAPSLEVNKDYRWYFNVYCDPKKTSSPMTVEGWIQRIPITPEIQSQINANQSQKYVVYERNGIWFDAIADLAELRMKNPNNSTLSDAWNRLFQAKGVKLELPNQVPVGSVIID